LGLLATVQLIVAVNHTPLNGWEFWFQCLVIVAAICGILCALKATNRWAVVCIICHSLVIAQLFVFYSLDGSIDRKTVGFEILKIWCSVPLCSALLATFIWIQNLNKKSARHSG